MFGVGLESDSRNINRQLTNNSNKFAERLPEAHLNLTPTLIVKDENAIASKPDQNTMIFLCIVS